VAAGIRRGLLESPVRIRTNGGWLTVAFDGAQLRMTGQATTVFSGSIDIDQLVASIPSFTSSTTQ
jgi:diaminopimelate epimerase